MAGASPQGAVGGDISSLNWAQPIHPDVASRAGGYRSLTAAQSMLDGLGRIPAPLSSPFENAVIPVSAKRFKIGPVTFQASVNLGATYESMSGSNSPGTNGRKENDLGINAGAAISMVLGEPATGHFATVNYGFSYESSSGTGRSGIGGQTAAQPFGQSLSAVGTLRFTRLSLGLGISFASLTGANRDAGAEISRSLLNVALTSSYAWSSKTSFDWDVSLPINQYQGGIDSTGFTSTNFINYKLDDKLTVGVGFTYGIEKDNSNRSIPSGVGRTQTSESVNARVSLALSPRLSCSATLGMQSTDTGRERSETPILTFGAGWTPRVGTTLALSASRNVQSSSSIGGANYVSSSLQLSASQRLGPRINLSLSTGYEKAEYDGASFGGTVNREDDLYTAQAGLNFFLGSRWSASLTYSFAENCSSDRNFSFRSSRGVFQTSFVF